jgi:anti-sigma regulatory factor (Ser/Thr protein kinase)
VAYPGEEVSASSTVLLPYTPASVGIARRRLTSELLGAGVREPVALDAALVMSELLSNALRHAQPLPGGHVRVSWAIKVGALEVTVSDGGAATRPRESHASLSSLGGRGLAIVSHLCRCWGVRNDDGVTTVWAVVATPDGNGRLRRNLRGVTERRNGDTQSEVTRAQQRSGSGGDREPHPGRGQRSWPARHGSALSPGHGAAEDNPSK